MSEDPGAGNNGPSPPHDPGLRFSDLRNAQNFGLLMLTAVCAAAAPFELMWAAHCAAAGLWMAATELLIAALVISIIAPRRRIGWIAVLAPLKFFWLGLLMAYGWALKPPPSALTAGILILIVGPMARLVIWALRDETRASGPES